MLVPEHSRKTHYVPHSHRTDYIIPVLSHKFGFRFAVFLVMYCGVARGQCAYYPHCHIPFSFNVLREIKNEMVLHCFNEFVLLSPWMILGKQINMWKSLSGSRVFISVLQLPDFSIFRKRTDLSSRPDLFPFSSSYLRRGHWGAGVVEGKGVEGSRLSISWRGRGASMRCNEVAGGRGVVWIRVADGGERREKEGKVWRRIPTYFTKRFCLNILYANDC